MTATVTVTLTQITTNVLTLAMAQKQYKESLKCSLNGFNVERDGVLLWVFDVH